MTAYTGALLFALAAGGVWLVVVGLMGTASDDSDAATVDAEAVLRRYGFVPVGFVAMWLATGWPAAGVIGAGVGFVIPALLEARTAKAAAMARTAALAGWAEMLRDTMASHTGLQEAIATSVPVAPAPIAAAVRRLAEAAQRAPLSAALRGFADEVADPVADMIAAALITAADGTARNLTDLLAEIAKSTRMHASAQLRIETGRARTYSQARAMVGICLGGGLVMMVTAGEFMDPFSSAAGQIVLLIIAGLFGAALWALVALSRPSPQPRILARAARAVPHETVSR